MLRILQGDCLEVMKKIKDNSVDLIITSPPYNLKDFHANHLKYENYKGNNMSEEVYQQWQIDCMNEMFRLLKDDGSLFYNHKTRINKGELLRPLEWIYKTNFTIKQEITWWQKKGANVDKCRFFPFSERIYWLTKNPKVRLHNKNNLQDVIELVPTHKRKDYDHPAVMPFEIVEMILSCFEDKEDLVILDPFSGVGSTLVGVQNFNKGYNKSFKSIGIELEEKHIKTSKKRLNIA